MNSLERRVTEFSQSVREIMGRYQRLNALLANGPHSELSQQEIRLVELLRLSGPQKMKEISEYLAVAVNTVTSLVDNLERKGHVVRERSPDDRRVIHVQLTEAGIAVSETSLRSKRRLLRSLLEGLPEDEQEMLVRLFRKIAVRSQDPASRLQEIA